MGHIGSAQQISNNARVQPRPMTHTCLARACSVLLRQRTEDSRASPEPSRNAPFPLHILRYIYIYTQQSPYHIVNKLISRIIVYLVLLLETTSPFMAFALSNLHSFSIPPLSSHNKKTKISHNGVPFNGVFLSPSKCKLAIKAMASEGKESLDHLQRASKAKNLQQQIPKSRIVQSPPLGKPISVPFLPSYFAISFPFLFFSLLGLEKYSWMIVLHVVRMIINTFRLHSRCFNRFRIWNSNLELSLSIS